MREREAQDAAHAKAKQRLAMRKKLAMTKFKLMTEDDDKLSENRVREKKATREDIEESIDDVWKSLKMTEGRTGNISDEPLSLSSILSLLSAEASMELTSLEIEGRR